MGYLSISLLGGFDATLDGQPVTSFSTDKARALLAYLAMEASRPHRRAALAGMFWPEVPQERAAQNLRQSLLRLRRAIGDADDQPDSAMQPFLLLSGQDIQFNLLSDHRLDVAEFLELTRASRGHQHPDGEGCNECIGWLRQAADLYRGDLLTGFALRDSVPFEEWQLVQQESLHAQAVEASARLADYYERRGDPAQVLVYTRRLVALEPWHERAQMQLMSALSQTGQEPAALQQFADYSRMLAKDFGLEPSPEARALYEQIRAPRSEAPAARNAAEGMAAPPRNELPAHTPAPTVGGAEFSVPAPRDERRQVTSLVCRRQSLDNTSGSSRIDPEELHEQAARCTRQCTPIVERYGGVRQQRQGAECLIYFGYPRAQEDAARRAVSAGLALSAAARDSDPIRIGIHTGMMVSDAGGLVGSVPDVARDCMRLAGPGDVVITADTERLVRGSFDSHPLGVRGSVDQAMVYRVQGERVEQRLEWLARARTLTGLAGREQELEQLRACLHAAENGQGTVVTLCGEPGIGISRLAWELRQMQPWFGRWLESRCLPYFQNTSLYPIVNLLEQALGFERGDALETRRDKLVAALARCEINQPGAVWLLSLLLGLPTATPAPQTISEDQRDRMREVVVAYLRRESAQKPLVLVIEDLHWADPTTISWLNRSLDALAGERCVVLLTWRPTFVAPWLPRPHLLSLELAPLSPEQAERMVEEVAGHVPLTGEVRRQVVAQTDGVPLFVEELTQAILDSPGSGAEDSGALLIPATLQDSLAARLDRAGRAKETAQWAAALGREFAYAVLRDVAPFDERRLREDLAVLLEAGLIEATGRAEWPEYSFKHALIQEAAYGSLLRRTRQDYHRRIADALAAKFSDLVDTQPEILAQHYHQAGILVEAAEHWIRAGERATAQGATLEARTFFTRALEVIEPADLERRWRALLGREKVLHYRGERAPQREEIEALLALAEALGDDGRLAEAYLLQVKYAVVTDDNPLHLNASQAACEAAARAGNLALVVQAKVKRALGLARLGDRQRARELVEEVLARLPEVPDEAVQAFVLANLTIYYSNTGDRSRSLELTRQAAALAQRAGDRQLESRCDLNIGVECETLGDYTGACRALEAGLALAEAVGDRHSQAVFLYDLACAFWGSGDLDRAQALGERALQQVRTNDRPVALARCLSYLGMIVEAARDSELAAVYLAEARALFASLNLTAFRLEVQAAEARSALSLGSKEEALRLAVEAWEHLREKGSDGMDVPSRMYLYLADVADVLETPLFIAQEVVEAGYQDLMRRADLISDPDWRRSFLEKEVFNRALVARWEAGPGWRPKP